MDETEIRRLVTALGTGKALEEEAAWGKLKPLGSAVLPHFLEAFPRMRRLQGRVSLVFHSIKYARTHPTAFELGILALGDKAALVRYRACGLLAYSLKKEALPHLKGLLDHNDPKTVEDAKAAIDAIQQRNHHYFIDRTHSGRSFWKVNEEDTGP